jgi:predicted O-linked N-acetylglucosamine transferase (SPINDLY family)
VDERTKQLDDAKVSPAKLDSTRHARELERAGRLKEAELAYRQVLTQDPHNPVAFHLLGLLCFRTGRATEALDLVRRSVSSHPNDPALHCDLASMLGAMGKLDEALAELRIAIQLAPNHAPSHNNLGVTLERMRQFNEAADAFAKAAELQPCNPNFRVHQGNALRKAGKVSAAEEAFRSALKIDTSCHPALQNLAGLLREHARHEEALVLSRRVIELQPRDAGLHSSYLYSIHYHPHLTPREIFAEHHAWGERHEAPLRRMMRHYPNDRSPDRQLRIGYVSPDLRRHSVTTFFEPLLTHHDHQQFEITCYSSAKRTDDFTERLRGKVDRWRDILKFSDDQAAVLIRNDRIDILVDLTGHMGDNRLLVFASKPAPVQITYVGHPDTTGMQAMDYRITDAYLDPPGGGSDQYHTEKLVRLPRVFGCYQRPLESIEVGPPPFERNGYITFGCLNNPAKVTKPALELWSQILAAAPGSRMILLGQGGSGEVEEIFERHGIDSQRIRQTGKLNRVDYLRMYDQIDIALDCFPYNGQTTSCDSFWMGVPIVALEGNSYVSRMGLCLLKQIGVDDLIARSPEQYKKICCKLAADVERLTSMRRALRHRLLSSPLTDGPALAKDIQAAYREVWRQFCAG